MWKLIIIAVITLCISSVYAGQSLIVTEYGSVQGYTSLNGLVNVWKGIPYAAPPVGDLRWQRPYPPQSWSTPLDTLICGNICPQIHISGDYWLGKEDCLYMNIYSPSNRSSSQQLPVFFWIYGGGYDLGDGYEFGLYDAINVVSKHNLIVVTFNYRLGPFGFLALKQLQQEDPAGSLGNMAILDQQAALLFVKNNIAAFGGDPTRISIAGESAGAFSTCVHLASPLSAGLFHTATMESGTCSSTTFFITEPESISWGENLAINLECDPSSSDVLQCLRSLDTDDIMGFQINNTAGFLPLMYPMMDWGPTIDGVVLTDLPLNVLKSGSWNKCPVIAGTNHDEGTLFASRVGKVVPGTHTPFVPEDVPLILNHFWGNNATATQLIQQAYPLENYANATQMIQVMIRDFFFLCPTSRALLTVSQSAPAYLYQFNYRPDWIEIPTMGVYHMVELEFVWDNEWPPLIHKFSANDQSVSDMFGNYWFNFVKGQSPNNGNSYPEWPIYDVDLNSMSLDLQPEAVNALNEPLCQFWDTISNYVPPVPSAQLNKAGATSGQEQPIIALQ